MRPILLAAAIALLAANALAAEPTTPGKLGVDSTFFELVADARTAEVLKKRMPGFVERFREDDQLQAMFGAITIRELSIDQDHARGLTPEVLAKLDAELIAAQAAPPQP